MTNIYTRMVLAAAMIVAALGAGAQSAWDFSALSDADKTALNGDAANWKYEESNNRWLNQSAFTAAALTASGHELALTAGLRFTATGADNIRIDAKKKSVTLNKKTASITIPGLKAGNQLTIVCQSSSSSTARALNPTNLNITSGFTASTSKDTNIGTVQADGDVTLTPDGGMYVYSIEVAGEGAPVQPGTGDEGQTTAATHDGKLNTQAAQALLTTNGGNVKIYPAESLKAINIDNKTGLVSVKADSWQDDYNCTVKDINFNAAPVQEPDATITGATVTITAAKAWNESVWAEWSLADGADTYRVYIRGGQYTDYTAVDRELVRRYEGFGRVDVPGLKGGESYDLKIVPVKAGAEDNDGASTATGLLPKQYDRSGFASKLGKGIGAYNTDGTLKDKARVIYVTAQTARTVSLPVLMGKTETQCTGLQAIIRGYEKGLETRPLCVRFIGQIKDTDMDYFESSAEGLQVKGRNADTEMNITIEGIGNDATVWGFGFLLRNAVSVELRNFGIMLCMDDAVSLDTDNKYCWVHHLDLFYGNAGGASDQAKGDGTIDVKSDSKYITIAYNHLFDSGKSSLCGMKSESGPNYIDYHHNWFDHSDSRHPRVRSMSVHVWNNYYDGCAKYGVGATMGSSVFVEGNFFRSTRDVMMSSGQGTDAKGDGTFSGEDGGMIKSFANGYAEKGKSANYTVITQHESQTDFDCYEADERGEKVPDTYKTRQGETTYNNFDTDTALMYKYNAIPAANVPAQVTGYWGAGRLQKGDFKWTFNNATDDADYAVNQALKTALRNYETKLKAVFD